MPLKKLSQKNCTKCKLCQQNGDSKKLSPFFYAKGG